MIEDKHPRGKGPRLLMLQDGEPASEHALSPPVPGFREWVLGRRPGLAASVPDDPYVSREHAVIRGGRNGYEVMDLPGSRNGTTLNGERLPKGLPRVLKPGDVVGVGRTLFRFEDG